VSSPIVHRKGAGETVKIYFGIRKVLPSYLVLKNFLIEYFHRAGNPLHDWRSDLLNLEKIVTLGGHDNIFLLSFVCNLVVLL